MTLGRAPRQGDLLRSTANFCDGRVAPDSIYGLLHRECFRLFPDELFDDLFTDLNQRRRDADVVVLGDLNTMGVVGGVSAAQEIAVEQRKETGKSVVSFILRG